MVGLLEGMLQISPDEASFGSRFHAQLNCDSVSGIREVFNRDDWTCQTCKVRIPDYMEVDHRIHKPFCHAHDLTKICQFCHNLKHPVWASLRGRLRLIWLPKIPQEMVTRMAWAVYFSSYHENIPLYDETTENILAAVGRREAILAELLGSSDPEGLFESLYIASRFRDTDRIVDKIRKIDEFLRIWPRAANGFYDHAARASASLSYWSEGKFIDLAEKSKMNFWEDVEHPDEYLEGLVGARQVIPDKVQEIGRLVNEQD